MTDFGDFLKDKRLAKGFTQKELATMMQRSRRPVTLHHTALSRLETGKITPGAKNRETLLAIGDALGLTEDGKNDLLRKAELPPLQLEELDVDKILQGLPERYQKAYFLHKEMKWDEKQIGEKLGIAFFNVRADIKVAEAFEEVGSRRSNSKDIAEVLTLAQQQKEHFDDIRRLISKWRTQVRVPEAGSALPKSPVSAVYMLPVWRDEYPILKDSFPRVWEECHLTDNGVLEPGASPDSSLPDDRTVRVIWKISEDGSVEFCCPVEDQPLFTESMPHHLPSLWEKFRLWKEKRSEYLRLCLDLYSRIREEVKEKTGLSILIDSEFIIDPAGELAKVIYKDAIWSNKGYEYIEVGEGIDLCPVRERWKAKKNSYGISLVGESRLDDIICRDGELKGILSPEEADSRKSACYSLVYKYGEHRQVFHVIDFEGDLKKLTEELDKEMGEAILTRVFPGKCKFCPTEEARS